MQTVAKYKETIVFVCCSAVLVGTVLVLQKATTPSRHRRRVTLSTSRAGTATRSASHGVAGPRSRSSSRLRVAHMNNTHNNATPTTATANDRFHPAKSRELFQAHAHRHHSHSRNGGVGAEGATSRIEGSDAAPQPKLTVDAVAQHKRALGTASALQDPGHNDLRGVRASRRGVSSSGYRVHGGSGSGEDGAYYRSASNAATVGSQGPCPAPALTVPTAVDTDKASLTVENAVETPRACCEDDHAGREAEVERSPSPRTATATARQMINTAVAGAPGLIRTLLSSGGAPPSIRASTTQTNPRWFCEDRSTQTERSAMYDAMNTAANAMPDQWLAAAMMSPIIPTGENANESILINCADLGWTPLRDGAAPTGVVQAGKRVCKDTQTPTGDKRGSTAIPRYFLQKLERQLRRLVDDVAHEEWNERAWMCLYTYLSDLPLIVRTSLTLRDRCGAATVARLVDRMKTNFLTKGNLVEESVAMLDKTVEEDFILSLSREVLHLLQHSTAINPAFHFEWRASTVAYVEGSFGAASRKAGKATVIDSREVSDCVPARPSSLSLSSTSPVLTDEEQEEELPIDDEEVVCTPRLLTFIATHIEKYNDRHLRVVATQFPDPEMEKSRTPPGAAEAILTGAYTLSTPPSNRQSDAALQQPLLNQQGQLMSLLTSFVRLRQTPLFHALRHTPQHALFACDFIELTSEAERLLERASSSLDTTLLLEIPMAQRRIMAETTDVRDTSVGTNTSVGSGSSPMTGHSARHSVKARTPMKPSIRYPIQRILSNAPSPSGLSSQRSSEVPGMQKEIYSSSVYLGEGGRDGLRASQVCEVVDL